MKEVPLNEYLETHSQKDTALLMEVFQATISKMVSFNRDIRLVFDDEGNYLEYREIKVTKPSKDTGENNCGLR